MPGSANIAWFNAVVPPPSGPASVQEKFYASTANATSHTITANSTPTDGNLMVLVVVSDTAVTTPAGWTLDETTASNTDNYIFHKVASGSSASITVSLGAVSDTCAMYFIEVSGLTNNSLDKATGLISQGATTSIDTGTTAATTNANDFVIAAACLWINNLSQTVTASNNGFSFRGAVSSSNGGGIDNVTLGVGIKFVSATGTQNCILTTDTSIGLNNSGIIAAFQ